MSSTEYRIPVDELEDDTVERPVWHGRVALVLSLVSLVCFIGLRLWFTEGSAASDAVVSGDSNSVLIATFGMGFSLIFSTAAIILSIVSFTHGKIRPSAVAAMILALSSSLIAMMFTMG